MNTSTSSLLHKIAVFKTGNEPDAKGSVFDFTAKDLQEIAQAYDPSKHECPMVIGHANDKAPAWGWAERFEAEGDILYVLAKQVDPDFAEMVNKGLYKKRSISLYGPDSPSNPVPGKWYPRHIAWLGASPPAKKGLPDYQFTAAENEEIFFLHYEEKDLNTKADYADKTAPTPDDEKDGEKANPFAKDGEKKDDGEDKGEPKTLTVSTAQLQKMIDKLKAENEALKKSQAELKKKADAEFVESLIQAGKVLPTERAKLMRVLEFSDDAQVFNFTDGGEKTPKQALHEILQNLAVRVPYGEIGQDANYAEKKPTAKNVTDTESAVDYLYGAKK